MQADHPAQLLIRDWSLITERGLLATKREGVLPLRKGGGADFFLAMLKGWGGSKCFGIVLTL